jgi:sortase A
MIVRMRSKLLARSTPWGYAQRVLFVAGLLAVSYAAYSYVARFGYQTYQSWKFDRALAHVPEQGPPSVASPSTAKPAADALIGRIAIPRLNIAAIVSEGVGQTLGLAVGHIPSTALPGKPGNVGLAAHRDTLFRSLKDVRTDDEITLTTLQGKYVYRVLWFKVVDPLEISVLEPSADEETLTLVTCYPFYFVGHAPKRFVVRARQVVSVPL